MTNSSNRYWYQIGIIALLFFLFGFITWLNGVLIPYLKIACELSNFQAYLVAFAFYIAYFVMALPSSWILEKTGFRNGMSVGLLIMAAGALIFIPAAYTRNYNLFLAGLFIIGTGLAVLQTASNPYITIIGPIESAAQRISMMGICNKIAGALSPLILGSIILKDVDAFTAQLSSMDELSKASSLDQLAERVVVPYLIMAVALVGLALLIRLAHLPEIEQQEEEHVKNSSTKTSVWQFPNLTMGVIALFLYVGAEVISVDTIINHGKSLNIPFDTAKTFASYTLTVMVIGYILSIVLIPRFLSQQKVLQGSAILGMLLTLGAVWMSGISSIYCIALLGLANAVVWPAIWPLAIDGLGKFTKTGSSLLIMAIAGGALLPLVYGKMADHWGTQQAYYLLIPCYGFIAWYAFTVKKSS